MRSLYRFFAVSFIVFIISNVTGADAYAYDVPGKLRVGLEYKYKQVTSVPISNVGIRVGFEANGYFAPGAELNLGSYAVVTTDDYFVRISQPYTSFDMARSYSASYNAAGFVASVGMVSQYEYYVYIGGYATQQEAVNASFQTGGIVINASVRRTKLTSAGQDVIVFDNDSLFPQISAAGADVFIDLGDRKYRGVIEFNRSLGRITAVNVCGTDEYLYTIVPYEMAPEWHPEALKAQAVAARSYVMTQLGAHKSDGYNVCDAAHCHPYFGASREKEQSSLAVNQTTGIVALYDSKPINAVYFSNSGGCTDDSENVWNDYVPYLRSISDPFEITTKVWTRTFSLSEITGLLAAKGINIGSALSVSVKSSGTSNRVLEMTIQGTGGTETLTKEDIRYFFSSSPDGALLSRNFTIQDGVVAAVSSGGAQMTDTAVYIQGSASVVSSELKNTYAYTSNVTIQPLSDFMSNGSSLSIASRSGVAGITPTGLQGAGTVVTGGQSGFVTFKGRGNGHGVGMSQYGAKAMAEAGYTYMDILRYYYSGVYFN